MTQPGAAQPADDHSVSDTLQSLIVAFVLAMAFRGFVLEGFIIPTGSMAPTLMGQHTLWHSRQTGYDFRVDTGAQVQAFLQQHGPRPVLDPMFKRGEPIDKLSAADLVSVGPKRPRMGDRILIVKTLSFMPPERWDVIVFKNPTDPVGDTQNYIKRLIGLPDEKVLLADGDVFAGAASPLGATADMAGYVIQRKPEHVQRSVWQPVYHSEYVASDPQAKNAAIQVPWRGEGWETSGRRTFSCDNPGPTTLTWDNSRRPLDDWTAYNMLGTQSSFFNVSDLRIAAGIVPDQAGLNTRLELAARNHVFQFVIDAGQATVRLRKAAEPENWVMTDTHPVSLPPPGRVFNVEFWHVDQTLAIYVDGERIAYLEYDWSPQQRLEYVTGRSIEPRHADLSTLDNPRLYPEASVAWHFSGSPVTLHRVWMDRDIFYQPVTLRSVVKPTHVGEDQQDYERRLALVQAGTPGFGTDPSKPAVLGPDHFMMCGDNSPASHDSRAWGNPDLLVADEIDPSPFVVNRKLLLGKAWLVYFPAPYRLGDDGAPVIPDFGRLRFIR